MAVLPTGATGPLRELSPEFALASCLWADAGRLADGQLAMAGLGRLQLGSMPNQAGAESGIFLDVQQRCMCMLFACTGYSTPARMFSNTNHHCDCPTCAG